MKFLPKAFNKKKDAGQNPAASAATAEPAADTPLTESALNQRALKRMRLIAILGILLILADLGASLTAQSVQIVRQDGRLYLVRPAAGDGTGHITLNAVVRAGRETYEHRFDVLLDPQRQRSDEAPAEADGNASQDRSAEELIRSEFRSIAAGFNEDTSNRLVPLPLTLDSGESIRWNRIRSTNTLLLAAMTAMILLLVYRSRLHPLQTLAQSRRDSVVQQLPAFLNELVLLLNAGLVLSRAFEVTVERSLLPDTKTAASSPPEETDYFRRNMRRIYNSMKYTNGSMHEELRAFAKDSGVSELMRISNIISDNINKGAALNEKLERESEELWLARKLRAEERGRLAETKMTIPLSVFLCVLIIITVAPALLQL